MRRLPISRLPVPVLMIAAGVAATGAQAQLASLIGKAIGLPAYGTAGVRYLKNDRVRTFAGTDFYRSSDLDRLLVEKASAMALAKGFTRIAVVKQRCETIVALGTPRSTVCYLIAAMLHEGGTVPAGSKEPAGVYRISDVLQSQPASHHGLAAAPPSARPARLASGPDSATPAIPAASRPVMRSAAELERERLRAAAAVDGSAGVTVR